MTQVALWHDTIYDALGADISAAGGFKTVASKLWPKLDPAIAATKLRNAINVDQAQKLDPDEVMMIKELAQAAGSSATVRYEDARLGKVSTWVAPEDELERIERENNEMLRKLLQRQQRADELRAKIQEPQR